jgi:acetyltransferase-like isoleucine patch superfamily enzyme
MIEIILSVATLIAITLLILLSIIGKNLNLFSPTMLHNNVHPYWMRWLLYSVVGFAWTLSLIRLPGFETAVTYGFDNKFGNVLRVAYWKCRIKELGKDVIIDVGAKATCWSLISIGDNSWIDRNVILETGTIDHSKFKVHIKKITSLVKEGQLKIGKGCHISKNVVIQSCGGVFIGDFTGIASGAKIYSLSHHYKNVEDNDEKLYKFTPRAPPEDQSLIQGAVVLEGNNAVGLNSVILPGVTVGKNSWIGVCSYVVEDIPPNSISSGCPAKVKKTFNKKDDAE